MTRVHLIDPSAFTPAYDHALARSLARAGADVTLVTSRFAYGTVPVPDGYRSREFFYRRAPGRAGSWPRRLAKLAQHGPDMLRYRRLAIGADVAHFQWFDVPWLDRHLLPRGPVVLTAHDLLPREPRPGQARAQRQLLQRVDAVIVHSEYGRRTLVEGLAVEPGKVHVVPHGAFTHLTEQACAAPLVPELASVQGPVALFFGLLRPYKGIETLLQAWRGIDDAELWVVGRAVMPLDALRARAPAGVRFVPRFIPDAELPALFHRADVIVLPYARTERFDQSGVLATALAFGKAVVLTDIGGFGELAVQGAAELVPPNDPAALRAALAHLLADRNARGRLERAATAAATGPYSWDEAARRTLEVYRTVGA